MGANNLYATTAFINFITDQCSLLATAYTDFLVYTA